MIPNNLSNEFIRKNGLLLVFSIFCIAIIFAVPKFSIPLRTGHAVPQNVEYFVDTKKHDSIYSILNTPANTWHQGSKELASFDLSNHLHWFKFTLNKIDSAQYQLLEVDHILMDSLNLWFVQDNEVLKKYQIGHTSSSSQHEIEHNTSLFPIPSNGQPVVVYISTYFDGPVESALSIWKQKDYLTFTSKRNLTMGCFFGLMIAMGLSNLLFFIATRSPVFIVYVGYITCLTLTLATLQGLGYRYIWSDSPWLQQHAIGIFANLTIWVSIIFCEQLLNVKTYSIRLSKWLNLSAYIFLITLIISFFIPIKDFLNFFLLMLCSSSLLIVFVSVSLWIRGIAVARYYCFTYAVVFISGFAIILNTFNIINLALPWYTLLMLSVGIESVLLTLILGIKHNQQILTLLSTQTELLEQGQLAQRAQKNMLALQENTTEALEYKVQERTLELQIALRELSDTNRELQEKSTLDALTGIRNRHYFDKKYQAEIRKSRREKTQLSVVMVDIDHFKNVNDQYGHLVGDKCIKMVAHILEKSLKRPCDDVCRYGGDEFALILPNTDLEGAAVLVEQLRNEIEKTSIQADDLPINITISAGIGTAIVDLNQPEDNILALADRQLYIAKNTGRNNVQASRINISEQ